MKTTIAKSILAAAMLVISAGTTFAQYSQPMHDVDNGARQPVAFSIELSAPDGQSGSFGPAYTVPAGKRLVIEQFSAYVGVNAPQWVSCLVSATTGGSSVSHYMRFDPPLPFGTGNAYYANLPLRIYVDPGTNVSVNLQRSGSQGPLDGFLRFSGYLVNLP